jgi:hypothetical protein
MRQDMGIRVVIAVGMMIRADVVLINHYIAGGRTWWAHFEFTRINITPIILPKKIEDLREARSSSRYRF